MKFKKAIVIASILFTNAAIANIGHNNENIIPFEHSKNVFKDKVVEKYGSQRFLIDQNDEKDESLIHKLDPRFKDRFDNMSINEAGNILNNFDATDEETFLSGFHFYSASKYQNMPTAIQQFYKGHKNGYAPSSYMYAMMTIKGEGIHSDKFKGMRILENITGDSRYVNLSKLKLSELLYDSGQYEKSVAALNGLETRDKNNLIGDIYSQSGDKEKAIKHYKLSVDDGYIEANYSIAKEMLRNEDYDLKHIISILNEVLTYGSEKTILNETDMLLGDLYFLGTGYNYSDFPVGIKHYKSAAERGHKPALIKLSNIYIDNEANNKYRLGKNKEYIHRLNMLIKATDKSQF